MGRAVARKTSSPIIRLITFLLPVAALISVIVAGYVWFFMPVSDRPATSILKPPPQPQEFAALINSSIGGVLDTFGIDDNDRERVEMDFAEDGVYYLHGVAVPENVSLTLMNTRLTGLVADLGGSVFQGLEGDKGKTLTVTVGSRGIPTDRFVFRKTKRLKANVGEMAIVIDDLGNRTLETAQRLCDLEQTVTLSIMPFRAHTGDVVKLAGKTGTPYMLHMPMEPQSKNDNPGKGAILVTDTDDEVVRKLEDAFGDVRDAAGMNNHMGSRATESKRVMDAVMRYLADNRLYFIDSRTSTKSCAYDRSQAAGVKSGRIDGFIDNSSESAVIEKRLRELAEQARKKGRVVVIGHDRPATVDVLERILPELEQSGIRFVSASGIIR